MLAKKYRFQGRTSLGNVFRRGQATRGRVLSLRFYESGKDNLRVAIVVSRKVSKSAVVRNRIRRRIYTFLENELPKLKPGDLVITCFDTELATTSAAEVAKHLSGILKQANIYK
jgi:ribonuclease P protein component